MQLDMMTIFIIKSIEMILTVKCEYCKTELKLDKSYSTRPDLISDLGEYFPLNCSSCGIGKEYHANDVSASESVWENSLGTIIGVLVVFLTTVFIWNQGFITNIGLIVGGGIIAASNMSRLTSNTKAFNSYKITRIPKGNEERRQ